MENLFTKVAERKHVQEALGKSEARLKEAERIALLGHWELDIQSGRLYWSDEINRIFEAPLSEFEASYEDFLEMAYPDDREFVDQAYAESLRTRNPYSIDHRILLEDGRVKFVHE